MRRGTSRGAPARRDVVKAKIEIAAREKSFASGLLLDLVAALRATADGELFAVTSALALGDDLDKWSRLTGNAIVSVSEDAGVTRWVLRHGSASASHSQREGNAAEPERPIGSRLWLYTNFHCNLRCDYCCVRSSPTAAPRELGLARIARIAEEAPALGVREIFLTGGEPFLAADLGEIVSTCARAAPTTVLTNGMLFSGSRLETLRAMPRDSVTLQVSLDSPSPELHDLHRGAGAWNKAWRGVVLARAEGFRVRLAATVARDDDERALHAFFDREGVAHVDRVVRRVALRGFAESGVALARTDLVPEVTITADGVYWHPVGAEDADMLVTRDVFPLAGAFEAVRQAALREHAFADRVASVFHCA